MEPAARTCPDCQTPMRPIKMIDATERAMGGGAFRVELTYAADDAEPGFFGGIPPEGKVRGSICPQCGQILLYGSPM
jgi:hypothetical protein